jgi:hypothetical protein
MVIGLIKVITHPHRKKWVYNPRGKRVIALNKLMKERDPLIYYIVRPREFLRDCRSNIDNDRNEEV